MKILSFPTLYQSHAKTIPQFLRELPTNFTTNLRHYLTGPAKPSPWNIFNWPSLYRQSIIDEQERIENLEQRSLIDPLNDNNKYTMPKTAKRRTPMNVKNKNKKTSAASVKQVLKLKKTINNMVPAVVSRTINGRSMTFSSSNGRDLIVSGRELIQPLTFTASSPGSFISVQINPTLLGTARLASIASAFEKFFFTKIRFSIISGLPTSAYGTIISFFEVDTVNAIASASATQALNIASVHTNAAEEFITKPMSWSFNQKQLLSGSIDQADLYVTPVSGSGRSFLQGFFNLVVGSTISTTSIGNLWVDYECRLHYPQEVTSSFTNTAIKFANNNSFTLVPNTGQVSALLGPLSGIVSVGSGWTVGYDLSGAFGPSTCNTFRSITPGYYMVVVNYTVSSGTVSSPSLTTVTTLDTFANYVLQPDHHFQGANSTGFQYSATVLVQGAPLTSRNGIYMSFPTSSGAVFSLSFITFVAVPGDGFSITKPTLQDEIRTIVRSEMKTPIVFEFKE